MNVIAGNTVTVSIKSTVPVACREIRGIKLACELRFEMLDFVDEQKYHTIRDICRSGTSTRPSICGFKLDGWNWNQVQSMNISTLKDPRMVSSYSAVVHIRALKLDMDDLWTGYEPGEIKVRIKHIFFYFLLWTQVFSIMSKTLT